MWIRSQRGTENIISELLHAEITLWQGNNNNNDNNNNNNNNLTIYFAPFKYADQKLFTGTMKIKL